MNSYMPPSQMNSQMNSAAGTAGSYRWFILAFSQICWVKSRPFALFLVFWHTTHDSMVLLKIFQQSTAFQLSLFLMFTATFYCCRLKDMKNKISIKLKGVLPFMFRAQKIQRYTIRAPS